MDVNAIDYRELAQDAKNEIENLDLDESVKARMNQVVDAFQLLQEERNHNSWYQSTGFSLMINGIDSDVYHGFQRISQKLNAPIGRVITKLMQHVLETGEMEISNEFFKQFKIHRGPVIQHYRELTVKAEDLEAIESISFQHIKHLRFSGDVTEKLFNEKIGVIQHCKQVELPENLSKLSVLAKTPFCKYYIFNPVTDGSAA